MTIINKCDVCGAEWDPRSQSHRRGQDCASGLKNEIDHINGTLSNLRLSYKAHADTESETREQFIHTLEEIAKRVEGINDRVTEVAKRVTLIEHPELKKVPSMPKRT